MQMHQWQVNLGLAILFQLCIPAVDDKKPNKTWMISHKKQLKYVKTSNVFLFI